MKETIWVHNDPRIKQVKQGKLYRSIMASVTILCTSNQINNGTFQGVVVHSNNQYIPVGDINNGNGWNIEHVNEYNHPITITPDPVVELTMDEIASKFNIPVSQLKIKK